MISSYKLMSFKKKDLTVRILILQKNNSQKAKLNKSEGYTNTYTLTNIRVSIYISFNIIFKNDRIILKQHNQRKELYVSYGRIVLRKFVKAFQKTYLP